MANPTQLILAEEARVEDCQSKGNLDSWKDAAAAAFEMPENFHWPVGLMAGFAGPILGLLDMPSFGVCFSGRSSLGKTLAQRLQGSVWANPRNGRGLIFSMLATRNALENLAMKGNHTTVGFDELALADPKDIGMLVFLFSEGQGKARQNEKGALRSMNRWTSFGTMTTERGLRDLVESAGKRYLGGMSVRVPDIDVSTVKEATSPAELAIVDRVEQCLSNYGHAGVPYVRHLFSNEITTDVGKERLASEIKALRKALAGELAGAMRHRVANVFAVLLKAGLLARDAGLLPQQADVAGAVNLAWLAYLRGAGAAMLDTGKNVVTGLQSSIAKRRGVDIVKIDEQGTSLDGAAYRTRVAYYDGDTIYVLREHLTELAGGGLTEDAVRVELHREGLLEKQKDRHWTHTYIPGAGVKVPHYRIKREPFMPDVDRADAEDARAAVGV